MSGAWSHRRFDGFAAPLRVEENCMFGRYPAWIGILALVLIVAVVSGCGQSTNAPTAATTDTPAPTLEPTLVLITPTAAEVAPPAETPAAPAISALRVAVNAEFEPFIFLDENGNLGGFDIELLNALSAAGGFEVSYTNMPFPQILDAVAAGEYDAGISAITVTDERKERVAFTDPYFEPDQALVSYWSSGQGIAVQMDNMTIASMDELQDGATVGVKAGTTGADFVRQESSATVVEYDEAADALAALAAGEVDAVVVDVAVIADYITTHPEAQLKLVGRPVTDEQYAIVVNPARPDIVELLNATLSQLRTDGAYDALFLKWFANP
jgi:ABC-type amino acid transport substrate-binding protein